MCPFKSLACEVLQIRNRCSTPPSSRPGIRLSGERECVFLGCGWKERQEELIMLAAGGGQSDRSASLTGRRVLIKVRVSRHAETDNEPHAEAAARRPPPPQLLLPSSLRKRRRVSVVPETTALQKHGEVVVPLL